jgi:hypothetical protein
MEIALGFAGVIVVWCAINYFYYSRETWKTIADELGLSFDWGGPLNNGGMSGTYRGMKVKVRGSGQPTQQKRWEKQGYTIYKVASADVLAGLVIAEEGTVGKLKKLLGAQDVEVGLPALDDAFIIKAADPALAREVLRRDGVEGALLELRYKTTALKLADGKLLLKFDLGHAPYETSAYLAKAVSLLRVLATDPPKPPARESSHGTDDSKADPEADPEADSEADSVEAAQPVQADWW